MEPKAVQFSENQHYEVNDAISEVVQRMVSEGQTDLEIKHHSLSILWGAWKVLTIAAFGTWETPGMLEFAPTVEAAINHPKKSKCA